MIQSLSRERLIDAEHPVPVASLTDRECNSLLKLPTFHIPAMLRHQQGVSSPSTDWETDLDEKCVFNRLDFSWIICFWTSETKFIRTAKTCEGTGVLGTKWTGKFVIFWFYHIVLKQIIQGDSSIGDFHLFIQI